MNQPINTLNFIRNFNLPENAKFLGYAAWLPSSEEFLTAYENVNGLEKYIWSAQPDAPHIFANIQQAESFVRHFNKGAVTVVLFDLGDTYWFDIPQLCHH